MSDAKAAPKEEVSMVTRAVGIFAIALAVAVGIGYLAMPALGMGFASFGDGFAHFSNRMGDAKRGLFIIILVIAGIGWAIGFAISQIAKKDPPAAH